MENYWQKGKKNRFEAPFYYLVLYMHLRNCHEFQETIIGNSSNAFSPLQEFTGSLSFLHLIFLHTAEPGNFFLEEN